MSRATSPRVQLRLPGLSLRPTRRSLWVGAVVAVVTALVAVFAMGLGDYTLSIPEVIHALGGNDGFASTVVVQWRLPRILAAIIFGAALAAAGALFQTLTRNPLGSPDIIGFSTGAYTGAIVALTVVGGSVVSMSAGALVGGLITAAVVYLLAWRGGVQGFRLIIVGIAVTAMLSSLNTFLLLRAKTEVAMSANLWGAGAIDVVTFKDLSIAVGPLALLAVITFFLIPPLRQLEMGDDAALAHGVRTEGTRVAVLVVGVALIAIVTAIAGPIAFIALVAPQITRRVVRSPGIPVGCSALMGSALLLIADVAGQHLMPNEVPVGIITVVIGGLYLIVLLIQEARKKL
ncbi:MAG: FecCD family ABC transporter permease [Galactobacter sp.]